MYYCCKIRHFSKGSKSLLLTLSLGLVGSVPAALPVCKPSISRNIPNPRSTRPKTHCCPSSCNARGKYFSTNVDRL